MKRELMKTELVKGLFPRTSARVRTAAEERDDMLREFIGRLDAAPFEVTDWEGQFIEDMLRSPRPLDDGQRRAVEEMQAKYEGRL